MEVWLLLLNVIVSLFTREWIEILGILSRYQWCTSPSLRGSGLKYMQHQWKKLKKKQSPSLRGSGLKCSCMPWRSSGWPVSLFTREWIEIKSSVMKSAITIGSPSLRGSGLKYIPHFWFCLASMSPSLRGSGLKLSPSCTTTALVLVSLFTREWIEIQFQDVALKISYLSPSLRGSGLKFLTFHR